MSAQPSESKFKSADKVVIEPNPNSPVVYANMVNLSVTTNDFKFTFGLMGSLAEGTLVVNEKAAVYMSPQCAKKVMGLLVMKIEEYETAFGPIQTE